MQGEKILKFNKITKAIKDKLEIFGPFSEYLIMGLVLGLISLALFLKLGYELWENELLNFDNFVTSIVRHSVNYKLTYIMKIISDLGSATFVTVLSLFFIAILYYKQKHFWDALHVPVVVLGSLTLNTIFKEMFNRTRPQIEHFVYASGMSFPSAHSMVNFSFYGLLIYLACINIEGKFLRYFISIFLGLLILLIGISRIYLGVHYPSDVVAGFAAGSFWLVSSIYAFKFVRHYKSN